MACPAPPDLVSLIVEYGLQASGWIILVGGWLCLLTLCAFLLRSEARHMLPGPGRRSAIWLIGTGLLLMSMIYPLILSGFFWESAVFGWSASQSGACSDPTEKALLNRGPTIAIVVAILMLLLVGGGWILIELGKRRKRKLEAGFNS